MPRSKRSHPKSHGKGAGAAASVERELRARDLFDKLEAALETQDEVTISAIVPELPALGQAGVRECERRLARPGSPATILLLDVLRALAAPKEFEALQRVARDRHAPDLIRFGAQRRAGWATTDVAFHRLKFLDSLKHSDATLIEVVRETTTAGFSAIEAADDVMHYLLAMPTKRSHAIIAEMIEQLAAEFVPFGRALMHVDDPDMQTQVIHAIARHGTASSVAALQRLSRTALDTEIRQLARDTAATVASRAVDAVDQAPLPPVADVLISSVDGQGEQAFFITRTVGPHHLAFLQIYVDDTTGVRDVWGVSIAPMDQMKIIREEFTIEGEGLVEATLADARGLIDAALAVNERTGHPLPAAYELWEPLLHDTSSSSDAEPAPVPELDDLPYVGRNDLVKHSARLLEHQWFSSWMFGMMDTLGAMAMADPPNGKKLGNAQYEPTIEALVDPFRRRLLRSRLRRQAWILDRAGDTEERDLALVVSASLRSIGLVDLVSHPFLRAILDRSVDATMNPFAGAGLDPLGVLGGLEGLTGLPGLTAEDLLALEDFDDEDWLDELDDEDELDEDEESDQPST